MTMTTEPPVAEDYESEGPCPVCGGPTDYMLTCPGWHRNGRVWICQGCGNAVEYHCRDESCGWWYRTPRGCRGDVTQMGIKPDWIKTDD